VSMTPEELAEIRAREQVATPGPWWWDSYSVIWHGGGDDSEQLLRIYDFRESGSGDLMRGPRLAEAQANALFVEHARTDIPNLLAEVDRLKAECDEWQLSFDLFETAVHRGTEMWREANPENELVLPSTDKLVVWLIHTLDQQSNSLVTNAQLDKIDRLTAELKQARRVVEAAREFHRLRTGQHVTGGQHLIAVNRSRETLEQALRNLDESAGEDEAPASGA
jgi:hypothetical protein